MDAKKPLQVIEYSVVVEVHDEPILDWDDLKYLTRDIRNGIKRETGGEFVIHVDRI